MDSEKVTAGEGDNQEEKNSTEVEEKGDVSEDAGGGEAVEVVEKEENRDCEEEGEDVEGREQGTEEFVEEEGVKGKEEGKDADREVKSDKDTEDGMEVDEEYVKSDEEEDGKEGEEEGETNENRAVKKGKKSSRSSKNETGETEGAELSSPRTPGTERPTRERKTVDRFTVVGTVKDSATKSVIIEKGQGTQLRDIPNVAFKLSKRKAGENLQILHTILYGKKTKVHTLKKNIGLFSGFVWVENEEKQRTKAKERIDKCVKEKLLDFCDVLNIPVSVSSRKEELTVKLLEFLESPHATTDTLLAEKDKSKKRKSKGSASKTPTSDSDAVKSRKKLKSDSKSGKRQKHSTEEEEDDKTEPLQSEDDGGNDKDEEDNVFEAENDKETVETDEEHAEPLKSKILEKKSSKKRTKKDAVDKTIKKSESANKNSYAKSSSTPISSNKKAFSSKSEKGQVDAKSKSIPSSKKQKVDKKHEGKSGPANDTPLSKKKSSNSSTEVMEKDQGKAKVRKNAKKEPSREELLHVVTDILKDVDFNTATLSDIHKQLGKHFEIDLMHRKAEIKEIITEVINAMSDDEEEGEESGDDSRKADANDKT